MKLRKLLFSILVIIQASAFAQTPDSLNHYLQTAAENNPAVQAAFLNYEAALQKVPQAGAWQDPTLEAGVFLQPMELVEGRQVAEFKLMQMFPWFGTRKAARTEMQAMAQMAFEQFREVRDNLFLEVYTRWYSLAGLQQRLRNLQENRDLLKQLETLALQKYSTGATNYSPSIKTPAQPPQSTAMSGGMSMGSATQPAAAAPPAGMSNMSGNKMGTGSSSGMSEVLRIQIESLELESSIESLLSEIATQKVQFNALLNREARGEVVLPDSLMQIPFLLDVESVMATIEAQNPMLGMINEETRAYQARAEMARKMGYPMFGIGLQYMLIAPSASQRGESGGTMSGMDTSPMEGGMDMLMPMVSVSLPIYRGKYRAAKKESQLLQQASAQKYADTRNRLQAELYQYKHQLDDADRKIALYRRQSDLVKTTYKLMLQEFITGKIALSDLLETQRQLLDYTSKEAEMIANYNTVVARIQQMISGWRGFITRTEDIKNKGTACKAAPSGSSQEASQSLQEAPQVLQEASQSLQEASQVLQEASQSSQEASQTCISYIYH